MFIRAHEMDVLSGMRTFDLDPLENAVQKKTLANLPKRTLRGLF